MMLFSHKRIQAAWPLLLVLGVGLAVRLVALAQVAIINPDGTLYIQQAKAISDGQWHQVVQPLFFVSLYPFLIAFLQFFTHDWILSGQLVSLCFGIGMLVVVFRILRLFFTPAVSCLTTLLVALTPLFVRYSVDVMRDAPCWFFFALSLWLVLLAVRRVASGMAPTALLIVSNCTVLLAAWSRIEAIVLLPATVLFFAVFPKGHRLRCMLLFLLPSACLALVGLAVVYGTGRDVFALVRIDETIRKFTEPLGAYQLLRGELKRLADVYALIPLGNYLQNSYHTIWITALGGIFVNAMEAFFYPYVLIYALGCRKAWNRMRHMPEYQYLALVYVCSFCVLLAHFMQYWIMTYRFIAILIIPSIAMAGLGVQKIVDYFSIMPKMGEKRALALVATLIFMATVAKNTGKIEADKSVYVDIGQKISRLNNSENPIVIASIPFIVDRWIAFYANVDKRYQLEDRFVASEYSSIPDLVSAMRSHGVSLLFWEENLWEKMSYGKNPSEFYKYFQEIGRWSHKDTGKMILFEVNSG